MRNAETNAETNVEMTAGMTAGMTVAMIAGMTVATPISVAATMMMTGSTFNVIAGRPTEAFHSATRTIAALLLGTVPTN